jgi:hypothetical protein
MRFHIEKGRFPPVHRVARRAFALVLPRSELAAVRIGQVTLRTFCKRPRLLEISADMAFQAIYLRMPPDQRIFGF